MKKYISYYLIDIESFREVKHDRGTKFIWRNMMQRTAGNGETMPWIKIFQQKISWIKKQVSEKKEIKFSSVI
jgi:hypothetical protein